MKWVRLSAVLLLSACAGTQGVPQNAAAVSATTIQPARISITVDANGKRIDRVAGDAGVAGRAVSVDDPARIASISKLVTGIAVMRLVDHAIIDLDRDIGDYLGWRVRNPAFPDTPVTMRMLLSHQSSITDNLSYILALDDDLSVILANPKAWDNAHKPGGWFSYANMNFPLVASVMEAATGQRFDQIMETQVFRPLKMDACFNWQTSCSAGQRARAITLLRPNGDLAKDAPVGKGETECPFVVASDGGCAVSVYKLGRNGSAFSPQGGLRISAGELLKIGILLRDKGKPLLSEKAYAEMTRPQWRFNGQNGDTQNGAFSAFGLSVDMQHDTNGDLWLGHLGEAYSLRSGVWMNPKTSEVRVNISTMVDEFSPVGNCLDICP